MPSLCPPSALSLPSVHATYCVLSCPPLRSLLLLCRRPTQVGLVRQIPLFWICGICTLANRHGWLACGACHAERSSGSASSFASAPDLIVCRLAVFLRGMRAVSQAVRLACRRFSCLPPLRRWLQSAVHFAAHCQVGVGDAAGTHQSADAQHQRPTQAPTTPQGPRPQGNSRGRQRQRQRQQQRRWREWWQEWVQSVQTGRG